MKTGTSSRHDFLVQIRRDLHRLAETCFEEIETSGYIKSFLKARGLEFQCMAETGVVLTLGPKEKKAILLRADMDALNLCELSDVPWKSKNSSKMHACGHDGHMAILLGVIDWLAPLQSEMQIPVKFVFQPAEEGEGGARVMIEEGVMRDPEILRCYGLHISNSLPLGTIGLKSGSVSAWTDAFTITITGKGGHASKPHQCVEPIVVAARLILDSNLLISRNISAMDSAVLTFTVIHSGRVSNIIEDVCHLGGTLRSADRNIRKNMQSLLEKLIDSLEMQTGARIVVEWEKDPYPATINDSFCVEIVRQACKKLFGEKNLVEKGLGMGGEDVSYFLENAPGCYFLLGAGKENGEYPPHHNARFDFNEKALLNGEALFQELIRKEVFFADVSCSK